MNVLRKIKNYLHLYSVHLVILSIWFGLQVGYFCYIYFNLRGDRDFSRIYNKLGQGLLLAKAFAGIINYNFASLFIFMNKIIVYKISNLSPLLPSNYHISFHLLIIFFIFLGSIIHSIAHIYNFIVLKQIKNWYSVQGVTGYLILLCYVIITCTATNTFRRKFYNIFINTHMLYIAVIILTILHGSFCFVKTNEGECSPPNFWKFIIAPFVLFVFERIYREWYSGRNVKYTAITKYAKDISKLDLYKDDFEFKEGQWILINCPSISKIEWHPFTITSNPIEFGHVQVFIKESGDWTKNVVSLLLKNGPDSNIKFKISYPYGNKYNIIKKYSVVVLIAGGIGITAFMSLIKSLPCYLGHGNKNTHLKKIYLYWVCRTGPDFNCFLSELQNIKREIHDRFELNLFLTGNSQRIYPPFNFILSRPNFENIFTNLELCHPNTDIKILFCGPKTLNNDIVKKCIIMNSNKSKTKFIFTQGETFF